MNSESPEDLKSALHNKQRDLNEKQEELQAQRGMLTLAFDELAEQNKNLEKALVELKEINTELSQLLYQSSHGLRSPVTSMQGLVNLMNEEPLSDTLLEYKRHIEFKISSMLEILNSLTTLSSVMTYELNPAPVNAAAIIASCITNLSTLAEKQNVMITTPPNSHNEMFLSDNFLILTILRQVVMNSLFFKPEDRRGNVNISSTVIGRTLEISVEDDGDGIPPQLANDIFKMFFRGSGKSNGSGLGLFIARKAADMLGGSIEFSRRNDRTVFTIRIPFERINSTEVYP